MDTFPCKTHRSARRCSGQTGPSVGAGEYALGGEGDGVVVEDYLDCSRDAAKGDGADDDARVGFVNGQMRFPQAVLFYCVENGGFVGAEDLNIVVRHA